MAEDVVAEVMRESLAQAYGQPAPPGAQRLAKKLHSQQGYDQPTEQAQPLIDRKWGFDRIQDPVGKRLGQIHRNEGEAKAHHHHEPDHQNLTLLGLEIDQHAADGFAFAHAGGANFGALRKQQVADGAALLIFLIRFQAWMFLGRLDWLVVGVLLTALGLLQIHLVALDVVDVLGDAPEFSLLRVGEPQHFDAFAVYGGKQRTTSDEPIGGDSLDLLQLQLNACREALPV